MCKSAKTMDNPGPGTAQENVNTNIGLFNMSSEENGAMSTQSIVTYLIAFICIIMVFKWLKKCYGRRQARKQELIRSLSQQTPMGTSGNQMAMNQIPSIPAPLPALAPPIIIHPNQFKIGLEGASASEDRMEKYRNC